MKEVLKITINGTKKYILGILVCSLISSFLTIHLTKFIAFVIDGVIMQTSNLPEYITNSFYNNDIKSRLIVLALYMIIFVITICVSNYIKNLFSTKFKVIMNRNLKKQLLEHTTYLEYGEYINYGKAQILQRVSNDANNFVEFVSSKYNLFINSLFILVFSIIEILNLNIMVSIVIGIIIIIIAIMSVVYFKLTKKIVHKNINLHEDLISKTMNAVYNPKMIKIFNRQLKEIDDFNKVSDEYRKNDKKLIDYLIYYEVIGTGLRRFKDPAIFLFGGIFIINGLMNIGALMVLMTYSSNLLEYVLQIIYAVEGINEFLVPAMRINKFLQLKEENKKEKDIVIENVSLEFKNVSVYINKINILNNISFKIEKGHTVYLVGDNGSGKSLIIRILLGFIEYEGEILLGGIDIKELNRGIIRKYIGVVFQEPFVFSDTIKNNIDVFQNYKDIEQIKNIAKICELDNEINILPNKYEEVLGERGINLSGGQKQRLSIARTLLQNKNIVIFDDVLSKVDNTTKEKINENLKTYNQDKIAIFITQDLAKIPENETVFFIDNKTITINTQKNLKDNNEHYKKLINICNDIVGDLNE